MQSELSLFKKHHRFVIAGLLAVAAGQPASAQNAREGHLHLVGRISRRR